MESLTLIVLLSVVVMASIGRITYAGASLQQMRKNWILLGRQQICPDIPLSSLCSVRVPALGKWCYFLRLLDDRRIDSGRGHHPST
jgi:hypothetical protein